MLKIVIYALLFVFIFLVCLLIRSMYVVANLIVYRDKEYKMDTFRSFKYMFWHFWVFDVRKFMTADTFLDRL